MLRLLALLPNPDVSRAAAAAVEAACFLTPWFSPGLEFWFSFGTTILFNPARTSATLTLSWDASVAYQHMILVV